MVVREVNFLYTYHNTWLRAYVEWHLGGILPTCPEASGQNKTIMIVEDIHIPVTKEWIKDVLKKRIEEQGIKIEDLFIVTRAINKQVEGDTIIETEYGKIRIFFREDLPPGKLAFVCHISKFDYPRKNTRLSYNISREGTVVRDDYVH